MGVRKVGARRVGRLPTDIAGCVFWINAQRLPAGAVASWTDLASGNTPVQATGANQPVAGTSQFGGRMSVLFDGSNDFLASPAVATTVTDNFCIGFVAQSVGTTAARLPLFNGVGSTDGWGVAISSDTGKLGLLRGGIAWSSSEISTTNRPMLVIMRRTAGVYSLRWNGSEIPSWPLAGGAPNAPATSVSVGRSYASDHWNGYLAEGFIFNAAVSDADVKQLETNLLTKWGLPY